MTFDEAKYEATLVPEDMGRVYQARCNGDEDYSDILDSIYERALCMLGDLRIGGEVVVSVCKDPCADELEWIPMFRYTLERL